MSQIKNSYQYFVIKFLTLYVLLFNKIIVFITIFIFSMYILSINIKVDVNPNIQYIQIACWNKFARL